MLFRFACAELLPITIVLCCDRCATAKCAVGPAFCVEKNCWRDRRFRCVVVGSAVPVAASAADAALEVLSLLLEFVVVVVALPRLLLLLWIGFVPVSHGSYICRG